MRLGYWLILLLVTLGAFIYLSTQYSIDKRIPGPYEIQKFSWEDISENECFKIVSKDGTWYVELLKKDIDEEHHLINVYVPFGAEQTFSKLTANTKKIPDQRMSKYYAGKVKLCPYENQKVKDFNPN